MDVSCIAPCTVNEAVPLEPWTPPTPPIGGTVTTANSASVTFTGDGSEDNPLTAEVQGDIEFEIAMARTSPVSADERVFAYATARGFTLLADQSAAVAIARNITAELFLVLTKGTATADLDVIGTIEINGSGVATIDVIADTDFAPGDVLSYLAQADTASSFDFLAITLIGKRPIRFV